MAALYGSEYALAIAPNAPSGTVVTIELPFRTSGAGAKVADRVVILRDGTKLTSGRTYRRDERYTPILGRFYPVFLRAELLREVGRPEEALRWYEALSFPFLTLSNGLGTRILAAQADALEALGRPDEARDLRERVRERWRHADVPLG